MKTKKILPILLTLILGVIAIGIQLWPRPSIENCKNTNLADICVPYKQSSYGEPFVFKRTYQSLHIAGASSNGPLVSNEAASTTFFSSSNLQTDILVSLCIVIVPVGLFILYKYVYAHNRN